MLSVCTIITICIDGIGWLGGWVYTVVWCNVVGVFFSFWEIRVGLFGFGFVVLKMK